jgi:hypothetical protein
MKCLLCKQPIPSAADRVDRGWQHYHLVCWIGLVEALRWIFSQGAHGTVN